MPFGDLGKFLFFFNLGLRQAVIDLSSPLGFPQDVNCVFFARTPTASGGRTFGACNSNLHPRVMIFLSLLISVSGLKKLFKT